VTYRPTARQRVAEQIPATKNTSIASQRRGKYAFATIEETVFSMGSDPGPYNESLFVAREAGSNTSTVTLQVVGGDKNGSLESETVKYSRESHGTRTRE
jgi:hypothetical protein